MRFAAACLLAAVSATAQRALPNPALDVLHYDFALTLPDSGHRFEAVANITVARRAPADTLALDLVGLTVRRVVVNKVAVDAPRSDGRLLVPLPAGARDTLHVVVDYGGVPDDGLIIRQDSAGRWTYFGDNWPNRARHWLPTVDHPSDKATVSWTVSAPASETVVGNGTMTAQTPAAPLSAGGAARRVTRWNEIRPISTYLMVIAAAPLVETPLGETACGHGSVARCVPQMVYTAPEQASYMPGPFGAADSIVTYFSQLIAPFPFEKLAHLQSSTRFGGMENATEIFYSDRAFRRHTMNAGLISHETAHQWFGDAVTEADWPELWLSEGFATYFSALWTRRSLGDSAFREQMLGIREQVLRDNRVARLPVIDTVETDLLALLDANSYEKGGFVLHMLRMQLGDSAFFRGLRIYFKAHEFGNATSSDLRVALEQSSGRKLTAFFDQWLRRPGYPVLTVSWTYDAAMRRAHVTVAQGDRFGYYDLPLVLEFRDAEGHVERATMEADAAGTTKSIVPLRAIGAPVSLVSDPDVDVLASITMAGGPR
ncbi:MAG TPA: M1 family metallopeptidase [Gemmatimonadaceae bacterium]|nr:M1 family metallopeptidase [Gemmatimonadaceae bacterium]